MISSLLGIFFWRKSRGNSNLAERAEGVAVFRFVVGGEIVPAVVDELPMRGGAGAKLGASLWVSLVFRFSIEFRTVARNV